MLGKITSHNERSAAHAALGDAIANSSLVEKVNKLDFSGISSNQGVLFKVSSVSQEPSTPSDARHLLRGQNPSDSSSSCCRTLLNTFSEQEDPNRAKLQ
jgi:hypothetical protein